MRPTTPVESLLDRATFDCALVVNDLERLTAALDAGQGDEHPHELTPAQADRLAGDLAAVTTSGLVLAAHVQAAAAIRGARDPEAWIGPEQLPD